MTTRHGQPIPTGVASSSRTNHEDEAGRHDVRLARRHVRFGAGRAERATAPFPSPWHRARSAVELAAIVVLLGVLIAALVGGLLAAAIVLASHVVDG